MGFYDKFYFKKNLNSWLLLKGSIEKTLDHYSVQRKSEMLNGGFFYMDVLVLSHLPHTIKVFLRLPQPTAHRWQDMFGMTQ